MAKKSQQSKKNRTVAGYLCPYCPARYYKAWALEKHMSQKHSVPKNQTALDDDQAPSRINDLRRQLNKEQFHPTTDIERNR